jgi:hypothetical protein
MPPTSSPPFPSTPSKRDLSPAQRRLVELLQRVNYGKVERLTVKGGQPCFDPPPRVSRTLKLGGQNGPRPEVHSGNFLLKRALADLFEQLALLGDGLVESIEVLGGLPNKMVVVGMSMPA